MRNLEKGRNFNCKRKNRSSSTNRKSSTPWWLEPRRRLTPTSMKLGSTPNWNNKKNKNRKKKPKKGYRNLKKDKRRRSRIKKSKRRRKSRRLIKNILRKWLKGRLTEKLNLSPLSGNSQNHHLLIKDYNKINQWKKVSKHLVLENKWMRNRRNCRKSPKLRLSKKLK